LTRIKEKVVTAEDFHERHKRKDTEEKPQRKDTREKPQITQIDTDLKTETGKEPLMHTNKRRKRKDTKKRYREKTQKKSHREKTQRKDTEKKLRKNLSCNLSHKSRIK